MVKNDAMILHARTGIVAFIRILCLKYVCAVGVGTLFVFFTFVCNKKPKKSITT